MQTIWSLCTQKLKLEFNYNVLILYTDMPLVRNLSPTLRFRSDVEFCFFLILILIFEENVNFLSILLLLVQCDVIIDEPYLHVAEVVVVRGERIL